MCPVKVRLVYKKYITILTNRILNFVSFRLLKIGENKCTKVKVQMYCISWEKYIIQDVHVVLKEFQL